VVEPIKMTFAGNQASLQVTTEWHATVWGRRRSIPAAGIGPLFSGRRVSFFPQMWRFGKKTPVEPRTVPKTALTEKLAKHIEGAFTIAEREVFDAGTDGKKEGSGARALAKKFVTQYVDDTKELIDAADVTKIMKTANADIGYGEARPLGFLKDMAFFEAFFYDQDKRDLERYSKFYAPKGKKDVTKVLALVEKVAQDYKLNPKTLLESVVTRARQGNKPVAGRDRYFTVYNLLIKDLNDPKKEVAIKLDRRDITFITHAGDAWIRQVAEIECANVVNLFVANSKTLPDVEKTEAVTKEINFVAFRIRRLIGRDFESSVRRDALVNNLNGYFSLKYKYEYEDKLKSEPEKSTTPSQKALEVIINDLCLARLKMKVDDYYGLADYKAVVAAFEAHKQKVMGTSWKQTAAELALPIVMRELKINYLWKTGYLDLISKSAFWGKNYRLTVQAGRELIRVEKRFRELVEIGLCKPGTGAIEVGMYLKQYYQRKADFDQKNIDGSGLALLLSITDQIIKDTLKYKLIKVVGLEKATNDKRLIELFEAREAALRTQGHPRPSDQAFMEVLHDFDEWASKLPSRASKANSP
jgi:hypothetical protein